MDLFFTEEVPVRPQEGQYDAGLVSGQDECAIADFLAVCCGGAEEAVPPEMLGINDW
ncbi:MAG: hypothetical protein JW793_09020 [Acidobacteria bacterium]|nr:hypothetical protein [Acidobacteriota bacterium]